MTFSIIIPTLNEEKNISTLLTHLFKYKTDHVLEIIVVDALSADDTKLCTSNFDVVWLESEVKSRAVQMNIGAQYAQGEILYFIHADTIPPSSFCQDIFNAIEGGYHLGGYRFLFNSSKAILKINSWFTRFNLLTFRGGDQTLFIEKQVFEKLGGFNEKFSIMEEYDLLIRAEKLYYQFRLIPKNVLVSDRKYDENSYLRVNLVNLVAMQMFKRGYEPDTIKKMYFKYLKHPKSEITE